MKVLRVLKLAGVLAVVCLSVSGCYTPSATVDTAPRFHEGVNVNVVLEFYKWDNFFIKHPDWRDNGFLRPLKRDDLGGALTTLRVQRDMAVVILGWNYTPEQTAQIIENWKSILRTQGFRRIVCLRGNENDEVDGKVIIDDWNQSAVDPKQTAQL